MTECSCSLTVNPNSPCWWVILCQSWRRNFVCSPAVREEKQSPAFTKMVGGPRKKIRPWPAPWETIKKTLEKIAHRARKQGRPAKWRLALREEWHCCQCWWRRACTQSSMMKNSNCFHCVSLKSPPTKRCVSSLRENTAKTMSLTVQQQRTHTHTHMNACAACTLQLHTAHAHGATVCNTCLHCKVAHMTTHLHSSCLHSRFAWPMLAWQTHTAHGQQS